MRIRMRVEAHIIRQLFQFFVGSVTSETGGLSDLCTHSHFHRPMAVFAVKPRLDVFVNSE